MLVARNGDEESVDAWIAILAEARMMLDINVIRRALIGS
jgi:hypothetical protein